jgi:hypothetical protein
VSSLNVCICACLHHSDRYDMNKLRIHSNPNLDCLTCCKTLYSNTIRIQMIKRKGFATTGILWRTNVVWKCFLWSYSLATSFLEHVKASSLSGFPNFSISFEKERIRYNRYTLKDQCHQTFCKILYIHVRVNRHAKNHVFVSSKILHVVSDLLQVGGFLLVLPFHPPMKLNASI